jgi:hypothetical protein
MPKVVKRSVGLASSERPRGPTDTAMVRGSPRETVEDVVARRGGMSRSDLARDDERKSSSPLGFGSHSKAAKKGRK